MAFALGGAATTLVWQIKLYDGFTGFDTYDLAGHRYLGLLTTNDSSS